MLKARIFSILLFDDVFQFDDFVGFLPWEAFFFPAKVAETCSSPVDGAKQLELFDDGLGSHVKRFDYCIHERIVGAFSCSEGIY